MVKNAQKTDSLAYCVGFFVYSLSHPMNYTPRFFQMKDLIKKYICIAFAVVKSKIFKFSWIDSASIKWPL